MYRPNTVSISEKMYSFLLYFYPRKYRLEYGGLMLQLFRDLEKDIKREHKSKYHLWELILNDFVVSILEEYMKSVNSFMLNIMRNIKFLPIFIFLANYIIICFLFWMYINLDLVNKFRWPMQSYINSPSENLNKNLFNTLFTSAQRCQAIVNTEQKTTCEKELSLQLAKLIKEEQLKHHDYDWPNDLSFVKQVDNTFYNLGWSGELKNITSTTNRSLLHFPIPYDLKFLSRNCKFFNIYQQQFDGSCEVYEKISLGKNQTGYIVRLVPLTESTGFVIVLTFPMLFFIGFKEILTSMSLDSIPYLFFFSSFIIIPFIMTFLMVKLLKKKKKII